MNTKISTHNTSYSLTETNNFQSFYYFVSGIKKNGI